MFPNNYFPNSYFPDGYFPPGGTIVVVVTGCKTFAQIKQSIQDNLADAGVYYSQADLDTATQGAYNMTVSLSQCIIRKVTLPFKGNLIYYNFQDQSNYPDLYVADYMACTAIFSNLTNLWLLDDKALKDFDRDRIDWENWTGNGVWWVPTNDYRRIAIIPHATTDVSTFDLYYWAQAPIVNNANCPEVPADFSYLIELYATAGLLELAHEFVKAQIWLNEFYGIKDGNQNEDSGIYALAARTKNLAKSDLLMLG